MSQAVEFLAWSTCVSDFRAIVYNQMRLWRITSLCCECFAQELNMSTSVVISKCQSHVQRGVKDRYHQIRVTDMRCDLYHGEFHVVSNL